MIDKQKLVDVLTMAIKIIFEWVSLIVRYEYFPHIVITMFVIAFVMMFYHEWTTYTPCPFEPNSGLSVIECALYAGYCGLFSIPFMIRELGFSARDMIGIFVKTVKAAHLLLILVLIGLFLGFLQLTYIVMTLRYRGIVFDDPFLTLFLITLTLFGIGVYYHYQSPQYISAETSWRSGGRFVVGGVPWLFYNFIYGMGEMILHEDIENRVSETVSLAFVAANSQKEVELKSLRNDYAIKEQKSRDDYFRVLEESEQYQESALDYKSRYELSSKNSKRLTDELIEYRNELKNERRRNATLKNDYEALQAKVLKEQFNDDDDDNYMPDDLAPDSDGYVSLGDEWEG